MANTPEELEQIRAYGQALVSAGQAPQEQPVRVGEYGAVSPLSILTRGLQSLQGRSALNFVEQDRQRTRRERAAALPGVGTDVRPQISTNQQPSGVQPIQPQPQSQRQVNAGQVPPGYVDTLTAIESGNNPNASTANGVQVPEAQARYFGLGQFSRDLLNKYGITNWRDPAQQRSGISRHYQELNAAYRQATGQDLPTPGHGYLLHQQGAGGGVALLQNPDETAFNVLMRLPYYKGNAALVRSAIQNNIPGGVGPDGKPLKANWQTIKAGDFANLWINRFNDRLGFVAPTQAANTPPRQSADGRMNLGAGDLVPTPTEGAPAAAAPNSPVPTPPVAPEQGATAPPAAPQQTAQAGGNIGQPPDRIPPSPQLQAIITQLRQPQNLSGEEFNNLLTEYQKFAAPVTIKYPFGTATFNPLTGDRLTFTPDRVTRPVEVPGAKTEQFMVPQENGSLGVVPTQRAGGPQPGQPAPNATPPAGGTTPPAGGTTPPAGRVENPNISPQTNPFPESGDIGEMGAYGQRQQAIGAITQSLANAQAKRLDIATTRGNEAAERIPLLQSIKAATRLIEPGRWTGETASRYQTQIQQAFRNFGPQSGLGYREFLDKLNAFLASEATQEISARGTNFEFSTLMRYNPNLFASHEGTMILIDYLIQEKKRQEDIGNIVADLRPEQAGEYNRRVTNYMNSHPIYINMPLPNNGGTMRINTMNVPNVGDYKPDMTSVYTEQEVRDILGRIPPGTFYISPRTGRLTQRAIRASASAR